MIISIILTSWFWLIYISEIKNLARFDLLDFQVELIKVAEEDKDLAQLCAQKLTAKDTFEELNEIRTLIAGHWISGNEYYITRIDGILNVYPKYFENLDCPL